MTYPSHLQSLNDWVSISAFVLGASMLVFLCNVVYSLVIVRKPAPANPWESKSLEWQTPTPVPVHNFERPPVIDSDPYDYGVPSVAAATAAPGRSAGLGIGRRRWTTRPDSPARSPPPTPRPRSFTSGSTGSVSA